TTPRGSRPSWAATTARSAGVAGASSRRPGWSVTGALGLGQPLVGRPDRLPDLAVPGPVLVHVVGDRDHAGDRLGQLLAGVVQHREDDLARLDEPQPLPGPRLEVRVVVPQRELLGELVDARLLTGDLALGAVDLRALVQVAAQRRGEEQRQEGEQ